MRAVFKHPTANRLLALAIVVILLLTSINFGRLTTYASFGTKEYRIGEDVFAGLDTDGHMRLYGTGDTYDYTEGAPAPFYERAAEILTLQIDAGITGIGAYLFYNCENLSGKLAIPSTVISIGSHAFSGASQQSAPKLGSIENRFVATEIVETVEPEETTLPSEQPETDAVEASETPTPSETPKPSETPEPSVEPTQSAVPEITEQPEGSVEPTSSEQPESGETPESPAIPEPVTAVEPEAGAQALSEETLALPEGTPLSSELPQETQQAFSPEPNAVIPEQTRIVTISCQEIGEGIFFPGQTGVFSVYEAGNNSFVSAACAAGYSQILSRKTVSFLSENETVELSVPLTVKGLFLPSFAETGLPLPGGAFSTVSFLHWQAAGDEGEYQPQGFAPVADSFTAAFSVVERELAEKTIEKQTNDGTTVTITGDLPENAEVYAEAVELTPEMLGLMTEAAGGRTPEVLFALDISILVDGEKFQPSESPVTVLITPPALPKDAEVAVTHVVVDEGTGEVLESQSVADVTTTGDGAVEFAAESFSIYIGTTAKTPAIYPAVIYWNGLGFYSDEACTGDTTKIVKEDGTDFATMQELVAALDEATIIYMKAAYTVSADESIGNSSYAVTLKRSGDAGGDGDTTIDPYTGNLIIVPAGIALTLADITIDGGAVWSGEDPTTRTNGGLSAAAALVNTSGTLNIQAGTLLTNNSSSALGGAVSSSGTVSVTGGVISGNASANGGGIYSDGVLTLSGSPTIEDEIYLTSGKTISVTSPFSPSASVPVKSETATVDAVVVDYGTGNASSADFSLTNEGLRLVVNAADTSELIVERYVEHSINEAPGIKSGRHFTAFEDGAAVASIPANGAFTMCSNVSYTPSDEASVRAHALVTDTPLPAGTKITLCEYTQGRSGYYYHEAAGAQTVIPLADFKRMGTSGGAENMYAEPVTANTQLNEILVISVQLPAGNTATGNLDVSLHIGTTELGAFTVTMTAAEGSSGSISLGATSAGAGTLSVPVTVTASGQGHKVLAFSLQDGSGAAQAFPTGASASLGEIATAVIRGNLIIFDLGTSNVASNTFTFSLTGLPAGSYKLQAEVCIVRAGEQSYPMRGSKNSAVTDAAAVSEAEKYALRATLTSGGRILPANTQTSMTFSLRYAPASAIGFSASLYIKDGGAYSQAAPWGSEPVFVCSGGTGTATVTLPALETGTYRIVFSLGGAETPYNIIVE